MDDVEKDEYDKAVDEINAMTTVIAESIGGLGYGASPRLCFVLMSLAHANCKAVGFDPERVLADVEASSFTIKSVKSASVN